MADQQLNSSEEQRRHEMNIALTQYRDNLLTDHIREIGELLKMNNGSLTNDFVTKTLTRAKTLAAIRQLDPSQNVELIRFLYEAVLSARFEGKSTSITIGYSGNIYSLNSTHKEPIRFPLNYSMAMEIIRVAIIFGPSNDDLIPSWCDDIEVAVEVNDEPS
ncbi:unnamed protein product [Rotaria sordida]|uniref:Uncharacterized protein n=1 Tax=Rotaria sordida TaxID=392033 RepID=A0A815E0H5_9BILA|nr:unnamed protein product [Rotaria sordida]CAF1575840.1 unnamed protein product [Rotaria sordida]